MAQWNASLLSPLTITRHYATNQQLTGSIPDGVIGIFHWHNPSGRTMALESTQPLTEMSTRLFPGGKDVRCVRLTTLPPSVPLSWNLGTLTSWNPLGHSRPVTELLYLHYYGGHQIKEDSMEYACSTHGTEEKRVSGFVLKTWKRSYEDLSLSGRIILQWISKIEWLGVDWINLARDGDSCHDLWNTVMNLHVCTVHQ